MSTKRKDGLTWAELRFSIIGGLLANPPEKGELGKRLEALASKNYQHPKKRHARVTFGVSTIERWYYKALNGTDPVKILQRKIRSDFGDSKAMSQELIGILGKQYKVYPDWSYRLHSDNLAALVLEKVELGDAPSYSTVLRRMQERGWYKKSSRRNPTPGQEQAAERLEQREVRSYEAKFVHSLWHLDFHAGHLRVVDDNGEWFTPKAFCVLDDRSRLCCHMQWYLGETAEFLIHGLTQAFHKRGLPRSLMTDNGAAMLAHETENGLLSLGVKHEKTLPYSPYQNGKQESFWGQLEGRLIKMLSKVNPITLKFLNKVTQAWIEMEYNRSIHEEIGTSPIDRVLKEDNVSRPSPGSDTIRFAFTVQEGRTQRKSDGTVRIKNIRFEVPSRYRHLTRLQVRYQTWDLSMVWLVAEHTNDLLACVYPQDKEKNANSARRAIHLTSDDTPRETQIDSDPIPPLLRKIMADYAATGLPPAYIISKERVLVTDIPKGIDNE
jgi:transposase InsO family protein